MKKSFIFKTLSAAIALLSGSQAALAITPWQANDSNASNYGTPDYVFYTSGGAAQDLAFQQVVLDALAKTNADGSTTVDIFQDVLAGSSNGSRFTAFYFIGSNNLTNASLRGKKILLEKRSLGAAGYGVIPLINNLPLDHLNIFQSTTSKTQATWTKSTSSIPVNKVATTVTFWGTSPDTTPGNFLTSTPSQGGFLGVDAPVVLNFGTQNYPDPVNEVSTGKPTANWPLSLSPTDLSNSGITRLPTGGLVYGIAVTLDLYKVLQAAQKATGTLPSATVIGNYDANSLPTLSRNFVAQILAGNILHWSDVKLNVGGVEKSLNDSSILTAAGVSAPTTQQVAVGLRNTGAAVGAVAYAKFLGYPYETNQNAPTPAVATPDSSVAEANAFPLVKNPAGASATESLLVDWQSGTNSSKFNHVASGAGFAKYWGIAITSSDRNNSVTAAGAGGKAYRHVRIDGYAPTIENVASGNYPIWAEGEVLYRPDAPQEAQDLLTDFAHGLSSIAVGNDVDAALIQPWGQTGIFATTVSDSGAVDVPFVASHPIVGLTHLGSDGFTDLGAVPHAFDNGTHNIIQLK